MNRWVGWCIGGYGGVEVVRGNLGLMVSGWRELVRDVLRRGGRSIWVWGVDRERVWH